MSPVSRDARSWIGTAFGAAQLASVASGLLPWPAGIATLAVTWWVARRTATAGPAYLRVAQVLALVLVSAVGLQVVLGTHAALSQGLLDPLAALRSLTWLLVVLTLIMAPTWHTVRDYRAWIGVTAGVLIAAAAPASPGGRINAGSAVLILAWAVLMVAALMLQRAALVARASVVAVPAAGRQQATGAPPRGSWLIGPIGVSVVAGTLVYLALPGAAGGAGVPFRLAHDLLHSGGRFGETRLTAGVDTSGSGDLDLRVRGSLAATPLLKVPAQSPPLWRGTIYATYTGQSWQAESYPSLPETFISGSDVAVPSVATDPPAPGAAHRRYLVQPQQQHVISLVWAPGVPLRIAGPSLHNVARSTAFVRILAQPVAPYTVTAAVPTQSLARLRVTPATPTPDGVWTDLPADLPSRIATLARAATTGATTRYEQVTDLERYLRGHETYSLTSPVPSGTQDAVDDFLFRDHVGFCEQFASAEAVMLRTLGVPARVVTGLAYGERDGTTRLLRSNDAHAWVEVNYPNAGWVPTDPTAGVTLADTSSSAGNWLTRAVGHITDTVPGGGLGILITLIALALAGTAGVRLAGHRPGLPWRYGRTADPARAPVLAAFHRFTVRRRRRQARAPSETAREYVGRTAAADRLHAAVGTLERESYGAEPPDEPDVSAAVVAFDGTDAR